jgi:predicted signal transduction protein with EAL and GGDEF domain
MVNNPSFRTIVRTTIDLAHQLGVKVVAEGVESEAVRSELQSLGCDAAQGFLTGRPMPAAMFANWLRDRDQPTKRGLAGSPAAPRSGQPQRTAAASGCGPPGSGWRVPDGRPRTALGVSRWRPRPPC